MHLQIPLASFAAKYSQMKKRSVENATLRILKTLKVDALSEHLYYRIGRTNIGCTN